MSEEAENTELGENLENMKPAFLVGDFADVEAQAKAYPELQKMHGEKMTEFESIRKTNEELSAKFGAPEEYALPEIEGIEWDDADPMLTGFKELARNNDWNQETANSILEMYASNQLGQAKAESERIQEEFSKLDNAETRIKNVQDYIQANFADYAEGFEALTTDVKGFEAVEAMLEKIGKAPASPNEYAGMNVPSLEEVQNMQFKTNEAGQRLMQIDPNYAAKVRKLMAFHVGKGDHVETIG